MLVSATVYAKNDVIIEYNDMVITVEDIYGRIAMIPEGKKKAYLASRDRVNAVVQAALENKIAVKEWNKYCEKQIGRCKEVNDEFDKEYKKNYYNSNDEALVDILLKQEKIIQRHYNLKKEEYGAAKWIEKNISELMENKNFENIAMEKYLTRSKESEKWEDVKSKWINRVKNEYAKRKRLEIKNTLIDANALVKYPEVFDSLINVYEE